MVILSKQCKPDNIQPDNSLKLSFTNIRGVPSNLVDFESYLESNTPEILALCESIWDASTDAGNFFVTDYFTLTQKDSLTHIQCLAIYVKEGLPFALKLSLENSAKPYLRF